MKEKLQEYVQRPDGSFTWRKGRRAAFRRGLVAYELTLVSQTWKGIRWEHHLAVLVPQGEQSSGTAMLFLTGGSRLYLSHFAHIAERTGCIVVVLYNVPCQPLFGGLREDALIAYTFEKLLETGDTDWPLLLPMTKSAVRAMDAVQAFCGREIGRPVTGFLVTGASKRGWTTWLSAAVDDRVEGIAPAVYDNLDLANQMRHQVASWGDFSERIRDYTARGLPQFAATGGVDRILPLVDPFAHIEKITVPKLLIIGTNDRYWPLDALNLYYRELRGEKRIVYIPNVGHDAITTERALSGLEMFLLCLDGRAHMPEFVWELKDSADGVVLHMRCVPEPVRMMLWTARSPNRDFREAVWHSRQLDTVGGEARGRLTTEGAGYTAAFGEVIYDAEGAERSLSTHVSIL